MVTDSMTSSSCNLSELLLLLFIVELLSRVRLFVTPWTAALQASLSFTISRSSVKLMCIESMTLQHPYGGRMEKVF